MAEPVRRGRADLKAGTVNHFPHCPDFPIFPHYFFPKSGVLSFEFG
jgi:hypothetical protein